MYIKSLLIFFKLSVQSLTWYTTAVWAEHFTTGEIPDSAVSSSVSGPPQAAAGAAGTLKSELRALALTKPTPHSCSAQPSLRLLLSLWIRLGSARPRARISYSAAYRPCILQEIFQHIMTTWYQNRKKKIESFIYFTKKSIMVIYDSRALSEDI